MCSLQKIFDINIDFPNLAQNKNDIFRINIHVYATGLCKKCKKILGG